MTDWKYVASDIAEAVDGISSINLQSIELVAYLELPYKLEEYQLELTFSLKYQMVYNTIMTLANRKGLVESEKVAKLISFCGKLYISREYVLQILEKADYSEFSSSFDLLLKDFRSRNFHKTIVYHCEELFTQNQYFSAMSEACKGYNNAVKKKLGDTGTNGKDGYDLMMNSFGVNGKIHAREAKKDSDENALEGIKFLSVGLIRGYRNPTAHENIKDWFVDKQDCLDILSLASYLFNKLDKATVVR